jgi:predicted protein tyrosine phosphatase
MSLIVCPMSRIYAALAMRPARVLSLLSPGTPAPACPGVPATRRLLLQFHDIAGPMDGLIAPDHATIQAVINFGRTCRADQPLLVHCWAGISRSTAAAYVIACALDGSGNEGDRAMALRQASPQATPNRLMVALADEILGRSGRMVRAIEAIGRGVEAAEGSLFRLDVGP